jgi:hypothetical protein
VGAWKLILAVAFQAFSIGLADAFRKEINSIVLKSAKTTISAVDSCIAANRLRLLELLSFPPNPGTKKV